MKTMKIVSVLLLLATALSVFCIPGTAAAQDETGPASGDTITLVTAYPKIEALANGTFQFNVELTYTGSVDRVFDLIATPPQGWAITVTPVYETTKIISSITMEGSETGKSQSVQITTGSFYNQPEPGDYTITLEASSGEVSGKIDLTARVTAKYGLIASPADGLYSLNAKSGRDNVFSITVQNTGSAPVDNISFTSDKTQGWEITFSSGQIAALEPGDSSTVDVNIKPASRTVAGDYMVKIWVNGKQASADMISMRVTVETPSIWGWVGIIIILIVVAGLIFIFMRFGRR